MSGPQKSSRSLSRVKEGGRTGDYCAAMTSRTNKADLQDETPVGTIMKLWPKTIRLFLARGMACVGCPVGGLHTLEEACAAHKVELDPLFAEITAVVRTTRARFPEQIFPQPG
jgi:hybrid cluster-associated redox disulfide protein